MKVKLVEGGAPATEKRKASVDDDGGAFTIEADSSSSTSAALLLAAASSDFAARGLAIIPQFLSRGELEILREECDALVRARSKRESDGGGGGGEGGEADFLVGRAGCVVQTLPRGSRGAAAAAAAAACGDSLEEAVRERRAAPCTRGGAELAFGKKLAGLAEALLRRAAEEEEEEEEEHEVEVEKGGEREKSSLLQPPPLPLLLIGEQYIVKPARGGPGTAFAWHADGSWLEAGEGEAGPREPTRRTSEGGGGGGATKKGKEKEEKKSKMSSQTYLSVWIPLDDVGPGNGGLVLPGEEEIERAAAARRRRSKNLVEDEGGTDPSSSIPLVAAAGTAVAMASWLRHASGPNDSGRQRRAWMPQLKLGAVEVEVEEEEREKEEQGGDGGERRSAARMREKAAAARETWRVPVPCSSVV